MTSVEECTSAEIGVGAAIAIGSHGENGYKALLVMKVRVSIKESNCEIRSELKNVKSG